MSKDTLDKAKDIAQIVSMIAVPAVVAVFGWMIQTTIKDRELQRDYLQISVSMLSSKDTKEPLRKWAAEVFRQNSPVLLGDVLVLELANGAPLIPPDVMYGLHERQAASKDAFRAVEQILAKQGIRLTIPQGVD